MRDDKADVEHCTSIVEDSAAGAVVTFSGVVRNHDDGRSVTGIEYVAHPHASTILGQIAAEIAARADIDAVAVQHRVGRLGVGDVALAAAVSAAHRAEAFTACADLVDEIKKRLPVWKRQVFPDGSHEWTGSA
ncbi:molybdenum cofactor biosynthesis protein MoaE [Arthrobacter sp. D2]|nr:molybdenum cofactor biosynthesis protein MoaE [Arthrobacter sp. M5]NKR15463.1 molybdenum cofactor biosynthesis protein MoaE [Arthrobacter sp. M6]OEH59353.1 molybdenum cofactor biosynthesis protein MoaE [Arthrobacter sp. D2]OEH60722.1 molybdenum cofactor biosynthesis protein MoaE [Arthrobacter sp. D4]